MRPILLVAPKVSEEIIATAAERSKINPWVVLATLEIATMMLALAALDFLGLGIQPPDSSWGLMLAQSRDHITTGWWRAKAMASAVPQAPAPMKVMRGFTATRGNYWAVAPACWACCW